MSKKFKMIAIPLLVISISSIGISTTLSNQDKATNKVVQASTISPIDLEKQSLQDKMINSIDYFKNAQGSFRYYVKKSDIDDIITFNVKLDGNPASYVNTINNHDQTSIETTFDGDKRLEVIHQDKMYTLDQVLKADPNAPLPPKSSQKRYFKEEDGDTGFMIVRDPANMGVASSVLNNQYVALGFLEDHNKWEINENDKFLGLPAIVITGELPDLYKSRFDGTSFKILVHKDTGILFASLEIYDDSNEIVNIIKLNDIKLNSNYTTLNNDEISIKIPKEYKELKHGLPDIK